MEGFFCRRLRRSDRKNLPWISSDILEGNVLFLKVTFCFVIVLFLKLNFCFVIFLFLKLTFCFVHCRRGVNKETNKTN